MSFTTSRKIQISLAALALLVGCSSETAGSGAPPPDMKPYEDLFAATDSPRASTTSDVHGVWGYNAQPYDRPGGDVRIQILDQQLVFAARCASPLGGPVIGGVTAAAKLDAARRIIQVEQPDQDIELPNTAHPDTGTSPCHALIFQGVYAYDLKPDGLWLTDPHGGVAVYPKRSD